MENSTQAAAEFVPLISGAQTGPLGITHFPRFWLKMRAHAKGLLADGYRHGNGGSDENFCTTFGVDPDAFAAHIAADSPDYVACEAWVRANAGDLKPETIRAFNEGILGFEMPDPRRSEWSARFGLTGGTFTRAVGLNQLDDWDLIHVQLAAGAVHGEETVPAIGSVAVGPLGAMHLPRLWLRHRLHGVNRLPEGYRHGTGGFDGFVSEALGFDGAAFASFVEAERPSYLAAEAWVRANASNADAAGVDALNAKLRAAKMPAESLAIRRAELGAVAESLEHGLILNDLDDWAGLHRQLL